MASDRADAPWPSTEKAGAAVWGAAEATLFFIVPDVLLSWIGLRSLRNGVLACGWTLAGALLGGTAMWFWGTFDPDAARRLLVALPAIDEAMVGRVNEQVAARGLGALFLGPLGGVPYKIYAVEAGSLGRGLVPFLLISAPARLIRFVLVTAFAAAVSRLLRRWLSLGACRWIHLACWVAFYSWYFRVMPG